MHISSARFGSFREYVEGLHSGWQNTHEPPGLMFHVKQKIHMRREE